MLEKVFGYLLNLIAKWPAARPAVAVVRLIKSKSRRFLNAHPILTISAFLGVCLLFVIDPEKLPEILRPEHKCYLIETDHQELYGTQGDTLRFNGDRPCEHGQVVAFEFFNDSQVRFDEKATPIDLVSAGIFIKESARNIPSPNQWHEYTVFKQANNFSWSPAPGPAIAGGSFLKDGCGYDPTDVSTRGKTETREGLLLRGGLRSNPKLDGETRFSCNYGATPDQPVYKTCDYVYIEFFIPTIAPDRWCVKRGGFWDKWFAPGTRKVTLPSSASYDELRVLAQNRWVKSEATPVSAEHWEKLSKGLPKICMRWIGPKDEWLGKLSYWDEFASIAAVWCDY